MFLSKELNLAILLFIVACNYAFGQPQNNNTIHNDLPNSNTTAFSVNLICGGKLLKLSNSDQLYNALLPRIIFASDSESDVLIKKDFLKYLTLSETFLDFIKCKIRDSPSHPSPLSSSGIPHHQKKKFQEFQEEEEEDDEEGDGETTGGIQRNQFTDALHILANGQRDPLDNSNVLIGVSRILANVFSGNIVGVVNESVGLRSPEGVQNTFVDVLSSIFGSNATAGVTGIIGNVTTTVSPHPVTSTSPDPLLKEFRQQQEYIQQLKEQGVLDQAMAIAAHHQSLWNQQQSPDQGGIRAGVIISAAGGDDESGGEVDALNFQQKLLHLQRTKLQERLQQLNLVKPQSTLLQQVQPQLILQRLQEQPDHLQLHQQLQHPIQLQQPRPQPQPTYHPELLNHKPIHLLQQQQRPNRPQFQEKPVQPQFQQRKPIQPQQHFHRPQPIRHRPQQQQQGYQPHIQIHGLPRKDSSAATAALSTSPSVDSAPATTDLASEATSDDSTTTSAAS